MKGSFDKKLEQLRLQHEIYNLLHEDNGVSSHFDYHVNIMSDDESIKLNLLTYNEKHNEYMLFHTILGSSSLDCLSKMLQHTKSHKRKENHSYTISWKKLGDKSSHKSYFNAPTEEVAIQKFLHEKNADEYDYSILLNPVS